MSYKGRPKGSYGVQRHSKGSWRGGKKGFQHDTDAARANFESRSKRAQSQDLVRLAEIAPSIQVYLRHPDRSDWPNIDTPDAALVFSHKSKRSQAQDLAKAAKIEPVEVWIKDTSHSDIKGVDSPGSRQAKITHKFKIATKEKAKKEIAEQQEKVKAKEAEKLKELATADVININIPLAESGRKLPTEAEILKEAQRLYQKENFKAIHEESMPEQMPTKGELKEEGLLQAAKLNLMTSTDTKASRQTMDYIENMRAELNKIGFEVIPMEGFSVEDLKY